MDGSKFKVLKTPIKSENDIKEYKVIRLENGLTATIISDKIFTQKEGKINVNKSDDVSKEDSDTDSTDEKLAAATLYIEVGCLSDPIDIPGLSHFLEHMVFMGSEKFPAENDFDSFIRKGGGWDNACTEYESTTFYFECLEKHLPEALDKFSQFFKAPLMKEEALTREREAVDCEFQMTMLADCVRKIQLLTSLAKEGSPVQRSFPWGNLKTLKDNVSDENLYKALHDHRTRHYSAHRMALAIQARLPMETLQDLVIDNFSSIPSNNLPGIDFTPFSDGVFDTPEFNKIYYIKPINEITELSLCWSLPSMKYEYKSNPMRYLCNLLGDEGKGSILSYLKSRTWALSLTAGNCDSELDNNSIFSLFFIHIELTEEGLKYVFDVIEVIFSYINLLKRIGPQKRFYDELKCISDTDFKFEEEGSALSVVQELVPSMLRYPSEDLIRGRKLYYEYNPDKITIVLDHFTARRVNIGIISKKLPENVKFDKTEKWVGTEYTSRNIPEELIDKWRSVAPYPQLGIPPPNPYITKDYTLLPKLPSHPEYPQQIIDTPKCELWYRQDQKFMLPTAQYEFLLLNPLFIESPKNSALSDMFVDLLSFSIGEEKYPSSFASLSCYFSNDGRGVTFGVSGYNENLPKLVKLMTKYIKNLCDYINQDMFQGVKETLLKNYYNRLFQPYSLSDEVFNKLLVKNYFSPIDTYAELLKLTYDDMQEFIKHCHDQLYVKALIQGNVSPDIACDTVNKLIDDLEFHEIPKKNYPKYVMPEVPIGEKCLLVESFNKKDPNCGTTNYYQVGLFNIRDSVIMDVIIRIIDEPMFNVLRTNEQLGYFVYCSVGRCYGVLEYVLAVYSQANKFTTEYLDTRMENFLRHTHNLVENTGVDELEKIKEDLIKTKECCDHNLGEEVNRNFEEITSDEYMFDRAKKEVEAIKEITLEDLKVWWNQHNDFENKNNFRKISIQIVGHVQDDNSTSKEKIVEQQNDIKDTTLKILGNNATPEGKDPDYFIQDIDSFKAELCAYSKDNEQ